jgi:hypothetical protein
MNTLSSAQAKLVMRLGIEPVAVDPKDKIGIARNVRDGVRPVNGLRHPPDDGTTGWFIWAGGEPSPDPDFFLPVHAEHISQWCPEAEPYLVLPPGWRFQIAPGHEDTWFDASLLDT